MNGELKLERRLSHNSPEEFDENHERMNQDSL
jgi:hypothetical protein